MVQPQTGSTATLFSSLENQTAEDESQKMQDYMKVQAPYRIDIDIQNDDQRN